MPSRVDVDLEAVLEAVAHELRVRLGLTEDVCYWSLDDEGGGVPNAGDHWIVVSPSAGQFDQAAFDGGGAQQLTVETDIDVTLHAVCNLDEPGRDRERLMNRDHGLLGRLSKAIKALGGLDVLVSGNLVLRAQIFPRGFTRPRRDHDQDGWVSMTVAFAISFDWDMDP